MRGSELGGSVTVAIVVSRVLGSRMGTAHYIGFR
jgi:hypothetical protein